MHAITVLGEYKVTEDKREEFQALLPDVKKELVRLGAKDILFFEGTDQPGLVVEKFIVSDMSAYERLKNARYEEVSAIWQQFHACIPGGRDKVHVWAFSKLDVE